MPDSRPLLSSPLLSSLLLGSLGVTTSGCGQSGDAPEHPARDEPGVEFRTSLQDLDDGLLIHLAGDIECFDEFCYAIDSSVNGINGSALGGVSEVASPWGTALSFDGVDDWIALSSDLRAPATYGGSGGVFTLSARIRVDDADKVNRLCFGCTPVKWITVGSDVNGRVVRTKVRDVVHGGDHVHESTAVVPEGEWFTVVMIVDGGQGMVYQFDCDRGDDVTAVGNPDPYDPIYDSTFADSDLGLYDYSDSYIGKGDTGKWFEGEIDDFKVWDRALSAAERAMLCADPADPPCETSLTIDPPSGPTSYTLPTADYIYVENTAELQEAIEDGIYENVILEDGQYDHTGLSVVSPNTAPLGQNGEWLQIRGQNLWAENVGQAVLNFGIATGGNNGGGNTYTGAELHGLVFDIDDSDHAVTTTSPGACNGTTETNPTMVVEAWGNATDLTVADCGFKGNAVVGSGIRTIVLDGLIVERSEFYDFTRYGISATDSLTAVLQDPMLIRDVVIEGVMDPSCWDDECDGCGYYPGVMEHAIFLGDYADIDRVRVRDVRSSGIGIGQESEGTTIDDVDIDRVGVGRDTIGVGVYFQDAVNAVLSNFCVGPLTRIGVNSEWDGCGGTQEVGPRGLFNTVQDGDVASWLIGVHFDQGTVDGLIDSVTFHEYRRAGVVMHNNYTEEPSSDCPPTPEYDDGSTEQNNVFLESEGSGRCDVTRDVWNSTSPTCEM